MATGLIGLDVGTSAVRAAQVVATRGGGYSLVGFGQVALPPGAVGDGEVRDPEPVSEAIAQLWKRAKLRTKRAVIGVANQRVVVRTVDFPFMDEKDFRSSLRFQAADHIPMPIEDAQLDFQMIGEYTTDSGDHMMRVLLVAAATDMVEGFVSAAAGGGVEASAVDLTPFAVARAVSGAARGEVGMAGSEAVVDVGAGVTNIVIHHNGEPRFVRILLVGGDDATSALADELGVSFDEAEALKLDLGRGVGSPETQQVLGMRVDALVDEIRGSIDYYMSQEESEPLASFILTGGGSLTPGLLDRLEQAVQLEVSRARPLSELEVGRSGLTPEQVAQVEPVIGAALGLAIGGGG